MNSPSYDAVANPFHRFSFTTDLSSKIPQTAVYSVFKKPFPEMQTFFNWTRPSHVMGSFQDKSYLIIIGITCLIIMYFLWRYYFSKVYSLASFKKLNFSVFSVQKGNKVLFTKTLAMLRNGGCSLTLILTRNMLARNFDASWYFFSLLGSVNIPVAFSIHPLLAAIPV